jgi:hypothetical protein
MFRLQRSANSHVLFTLSGRLEAEDVKELRELIARETTGQPLVLDLKDVTLVSQDAVTFLISCEEDGISLHNCPGYIRVWIDGGTDRRGRRSQ